MKPSSVKILNAETAPVVGERHEPRGAKKTLQATGQTTSGAGAASVSIQVSSDGTNYIELGTISLTLSSSTSTDGFASDAPWRFLRAELVSVSGTGAAVTVWLGA